MKSRFLCVLTFALFGAYFIPNHVQGAKILFYFAVAGPSHRISAWPIIEKLAQNHQVTFVSPYPSKNKNPSQPNITDYVPENLAKDLGVLDLDFIGLRLREGVTAIDDLWNVYYKLGLSACEALMRKQEFLTWVEKSSFDLIVINAMFNECAYGLVHKYKAKHILYSPVSHMMWYKDAFAYPDENLPELQFHFPLNMTFLQSVKNEMASLFWQMRRHREIFPKVRDMVRTGLDLPDLPSLDTIEQNTSLIFAYTHPSEEYPRSLPPNFVDIGGIHCTDERKPLPRDLEEFINSSGEDGFVLLSFGTYAAISSLPQNLQDMFFGAMSKVPSVKFIVKFNGEAPKGLPSNVKTVQWIPQQDVIAHPKIRAFIGHGGLLGTHEAIFHAVPMIILPLFAEQDFQASRAHFRETAIALEISELTEDILLHAILEILNNKKQVEIVFCTWINLMFSLTVFA
ncbi:UDP-glucuronosyltransferase 2B15 isoform X2 [Folsomia candida]|uniref:UDP-glucuronosyltransferase 2B15 isoform X2 n=1 Tax=Folsomia candida TaxID=158441 RepID=UPI001604C179|nr:UDP-glucuronosyltransferase 2B15 isoform X2 [Folsomia candida]